MTFSKCQKKGNKIMQSKTERTICGTCEYWAGKRKSILDNNKQQKVRIDDRYGFCRNFNCNFTDQLRKYDLKCKNHFKWTELL